MKTILATSFLLLIAGVCFAEGGPQPACHHVNIVDILTYTNIEISKPRRATGPKVYALSMEDMPCAIPASKSASSTSLNERIQSSQTFTPVPLMNYYKELR